MADTYTELNPGVGGDKMDETAIDYGSGDIRKRPRVVIAGDADSGEIATVTNSAPAQGDWALATRIIVNNPTSSNTNSVAASLNNQTLVAGNSNRLGITIYNDSDFYLFFKFGATASQSDYTLKMEPYAYYETIPFHYIGVIDGVWNGATGFARITELI